MKYLVLIVGILFFDIASADSWGAPELTSAISPDSNYIVRIIPGEGFINIDGEEDYKPKARAAYFKWNGSTAYELHREIELTNVAAPIMSLVTNEGKLITIDNWYSTGSDKVVAIYEANGVLLKSFELTELFPNKDDYDNLRRSVS